MGLHILEQGLYTAIVAEFCATPFGGFRLQISGPTGAFVAMLAIIAAQHGVADLQLATLMAELILLGLGAARLGSAVKYIPDPVIVGFTSGIGVLIFVGQWKDFFGLKPMPSGVHFHSKLAALLQAQKNAASPIAGAVGHKRWTLIFQVPGLPSLGVGHQLGCCSRYSVNTVLAWGCD